jgi:hypothetical protein
MILNIFDFLILIFFFVYQVASSIITDARKYARLYGPSVPPINKIKRKV